MSDVTDNDTTAGTRRDVGPVPLASPSSLYARLRDAACDDWRAYAGHEFVKRLGQGTLPEPAFRRYLVQDYLFLIQFARAWGLAVYKSDTLADMRAAAGGLAAILDVEMALHVKYCGAWGLTEADMAATREDSATLAYTRYVLEAGMAGDLLDLHVALAPCILGYAEIGAALAADPATERDGNPYRDWIEMYAGAEYQEVARAEVTQIERLSARRGGEARFEALLQIFRAATRLETDFWQMGLAAAR